MKDTKVRIERSKFDVDCEISYTELASSATLNSTLSLPTDLKPSDFVGKILHFSTGETVAGSGSIAFETTAIITSVGNIKMTISNTLQDNTYGSFAISFMGDPLPGVFMYNAKTGQAAISIAVAPATGGGS